MKITHNLASFPQQQNLTKMIREARLAGSDLICILIRWRLGMILQCLASCRVIDSTLLLYSVHQTAAFFSCFQKSIPISWMKQIRICKLSSLVSERQQFSINIPQGIRILVLFLRDGVERNETKHRKMRICVIKHQTSIVTKRMPPAQSHESYNTKSSSSWGRHLELQHEL